MKHALVTGSSGFIGSHLAAALRNAGWAVTGVDRVGGETVRGDLVHLELGRLLTGIDVVFHLAARPGVRRSWGRRYADYVRDNLVATQRLLEAASRCPAPPRVVLASSSSVYGDAVVLPVREDHPCAPLSPYGTTKLGAEQLLWAYARGFGVPGVVLRYFTAYGPKQREDMAFARFIRAAVAGDAIELFGDGGQTRDFTFVSDIVAATITAATSPHAVGQTFNVGGGARRSLHDAVAIIGALAGRELAVASTPGPPGEARDTFADVTRARTVLGWWPRVALEDGLAAQWDAAAGAVRRRTAAS